MTELRKSITINAPVEKVFAYVDEPTNLPEIMPSLIEVRDVQRLPNGGTSFGYAYSIAGVRLEGTSEDVEYVANQRVINKTRAGIESTLEWTFQPEDGGTKVTLEMEYTVPLPVLGKLASAVVIKMNEREFDVVLANLKDVMEA